MIVFHVDKNFKSTQRALKKIAERSATLRNDINDRSEPLKKVKKRQVGRWAVNFGSQGGIYGTWPELAPRTYGLRSPATRGKAQLIQTGSLIKHFSQLNKNGEVTNNVVKWQMENKAGRTGGAQNILYHHFGGRNKGRPLGPNVPMRDVPSRTLWDLNEDDEDYVEKQLDKWMQDVLQKHFGL